MASLAICTYNRCESLRATLESLSSQPALDRISELLVVDNNSTDATQKVAESFTKALPLRVIIEKRQGLANGRNRAMLEHRGNVLLFTDDDMRFDHDWLTAYADAFDRFPNAQFFGGRILPDWDEGRPKWLKDEQLALISGVLGRYDLGDRIFPYQECAPTPFGGSFAVRRSLFETLGGFRPDMGRIGTGLGRGEETEFFERALKIGAHGVYVGNATCWHKVDPRRLTLFALFQYGIESGRAYRQIKQSDRSGSLLRVPLHLVRGLLQLLQGRSDRFRQCLINAGIEVGRRDMTPAGQPG